jgi:hypothetical protein
MSNFEIWDIGSMAWTEIGLEETEYPRYAEAIKETHPNWEQVRKILFFDVCSSFAFESGIHSFVFFGPILLGTLVHEGFFGLYFLSIFFISPMPDWGYDETYLKERMQKWESRPNWIHFLNPVRIIGYPLALFFIFGICRRLKREFEN